MFDSSTGWEPLESANTRRLSHRLLALFVCLLVGVDSGDWTQVLTVARKAFCRPSHLPSGERCPHHPHWRRVCPGSCDNYFSHIYRIQPRCDWLGGPCRHPEGEGRWEIRGKWEGEREERRKKETLGPLGLAIMAPCSRNWNFPESKQRLKPGPGREENFLLERDLLFVRTSYPRDNMAPAVGGATPWQSHTLAGPA